jgi:hypothetical protein
MGLKLDVLPAFLLLGIGAGSALAQGDLNVLFAPSAADAPTRVFTARKILTMEPANPTATAVAVGGDRILAVGSLEEVKKALADRPFGLDERFAGKILMPGSSNTCTRFWAPSGSRRRPRPATTTSRGCVRHTPRLQTSSWSSTPSL